MARRLLFLHVSYVAGSGYVSEAVFLLRGLVAAYVLGPAAFGVWSAIRLVLIFTSYADVGSNSGMVQSSPQAEGAGALKRADAHRRVASATALGGALLAAGAVAVLFGGWAPPEGARHWWWLVAVLIVAQQVLLFYEDALASQRQFGWAAAVETSFALISTLACIVGALTMGLDGFLLGLVVTHLLVILICPWVGPSFPWPVWRPRHALRLIRIGGPIVLGHALLVLLWNVDKLMLWLMRSSEELGVYALQSYFALMVMLLPGSVAGVVLPHLRLRLGQDRNTSAARPFLFEGTQLLAFVALPVIGLGFLALHLPIRWLLPSYEQAIAPGRLLILASFASIMVTLSATVLIALSYHGRIILIRTISAAVAAGAAAGVLLAGGGLVALAAAVSVGFLLHTVLLMGVALRVTHTTFAEVMPWLSTIVLPYIGLVLVLPMLLVWIPDQPASLMEDLALTGLRCGVLLLLLSPLAWHLWRTLETRLLAHR